MALLLVCLLAVAVLVLWFQVRGMREELSRLREQVRDLEHPREFAPRREIPAAAPPPLPSPPTQPVILEPPPEVVRAAKPHRTAADWEATVGGSWLNRLGVLILIIGVALFLGYSLTQLGPAGKIGVGYAIAVSMLGAGIGLERRPGYTNFARGFIGGGWAALYFTTFALHGLPAARLIENAAAAMTLLLAVSVAMIVYSLRYGSEVVTGLAYVVAFVTLQIGPVSQYSLAASIPLAASLVIVAWRFEWTGIVAAGLVLTYATYGIQYRPSIEQHSWLAGEPLLWIYWLLFECYDILQERTARQRRRAAQALFGLNAAGFLGVSLLTSNPLDAPDSWAFLLRAAVAFLATTLLRAYALPARESELPALTGTYEPAITVCAALFAAAIFRRFHGPAIDAGLLLEGEFLVLAGLFLSRKYFRSLAASVFLAAAAKLIFSDMAARDQTSLFHFAVYSWTPTAILMSAVFYLNRLLVRSGVYYSYAASLIAAIVLAFEVPHEYAGVSWIVMAACLALIGWRDLRIQAFWLVLASFVALLIFDLAAAHSTATRVSFGIAAAVMYSAAFRTAGLLETLLLSAGSFYFAVFLWHALPAQAVVFAWALLGCGLVYAGTRLNIDVLQRQAATLAFATFIRAWGVNFGMSTRLLAGVFVAAAFYAQRFLAKIAIFRYYFSVLASALVLVLIFEEVSGKMLTVACGLEGIGLLAAGFALRGRDLRLSGLVLFFFCIAKLFFYDLRQLDTLSRIVSFIGLGLLLVGASWAYTRFRDEIRKLL